MMAKKITLLYGSDRTPLNRVLIRAKANKNNVTARDDHTVMDDTDPFFLSACTIYSYRCPQSPGYYELVC